MCSISNNVFVVCTLCAEFLIVVFSVNSQELFEVATTNLNASIVVMHHVLAHLVKDPWHVLNSFTCCCNFSYEIIFYFHRGS